MTQQDPPLPPSSAPAFGVHAVTVRVNGEERQVPTGITVAALVGLLGHEPRGLAVAVDAEVVPRSTWTSTTLADGAVVEILAATQGG